MTNFPDKEIINTVDTNCSESRNLSTERVTHYSQYEILLKWGGDYYWTCLLEMRIACIQLHSGLFRGKLRYLRQISSELWIIMFK